jgi:hypothetical protein
VTGPALARLTSLLVVAGGGLALGHLLNPLPAGVVRPGPLAAFVVATAALGAWRGWRDVAARAEWDGRAAPAAAGARGAAAGAALAAGVAALGYVLVHGLGTGR